MKYAVIVMQVIVALGILNVWLLRYGRATPYRGGDARNMKQEFAVYGLPGWSVAVIGFLKLALAVSLIAGIWLPVLTRPAAVGMAVLMLGAVAMHVKVKDPPARALPACVMLLLSVLVAILHQPAA